MTTSAAIQSSVLARSARSLRSRSDGIAAQLAPVEQVEVAEDPVEHEGQRERQEARVELAHGLRRHRVEGIRGHGGRGDDRDHLVEEALAVLGEDGPMGGRRPVERQVFLPPLAEGQEQGDQDRADHQPAGDVDVHGLGAGDGAEHEAHGHRQHVEDHDVLEPERVRRRGARRRRARPARTRSDRRNAAPRLTSRSATARAAAVLRGKAPEAMGRCRFTGCCRSLSTSARSLTR